MRLRMARRRGQLLRSRAVLKAFAERLRHQDYYILQTPDGNWLMTTLSNRLNMDLEKSVVYGFPSFEDAKASTPQSDEPQLLAVSLPVTHILFQLLALERVESLIIFETPGQRETGVEVKRQDLQKAIALQLQQYRSAPPSNLA